jgi:hypothetical protein
MELTKMINFIYNCFQKLFSFYVAWMTYRKEIGTRYFSACQLDSSVPLGISCNRNKSSLISCRESNCDSSLFRLRCVFARTKTISNNLRDSRISGYCDNAFYCQ